MVSPVEVLRTPQCERNDHEVLVQTLAELMGNSRSFCKQPISAGNVKFPAL
jgi:hypothetical protein